MDIKEYLEECLVTLGRSRELAELVEGVRQLGATAKEGRLTDMDVGGLLEAIEEEHVTLERLERERGEYAAANRSFLFSGQSSPLAEKECESLLWPEYMTMLQASGGKVDAKRRDHGWVGWLCMQEDYLAVRRACTSTRRELADLDVSIEGSKRRLKLMMSRLHLTAATLNFLGSG